ncbi:MAG TPA: T9SS type A sorting domain-containing protein [Bacteroidia bacterium]|nr:T9SS type A sorting domain-containing protein [Bacteroidia bacterium]
MKSITVLLLFINLFAFGQISNSYLSGIYNVTIREYNCSVPTNTQVGLLHITLPNPNCLLGSDTSYTTGYWFNSSISFSVTPSDSTLHGYQYYNLASGKYFTGDSIHLYLYYYFGSQCVHEYFGKRKLFTGIEDLKLLNNLVTISPQPAYEVLRIAYPNNVITKPPVLYDMNGKIMNIVFVKEDEGNYKADINEFTSGIYFLSIETTAGVIRKKIIIVH